VEEELLKKNIMFKKDKEASLDNLAENHWTMSKQRKIYESFH